MSIAPPITQVIVTGAGGMLGRAIQWLAKEQFPSLRMIPVASAQQGGFDLSDPGVVDQLLERLPIENPESCALIHAAASIEWSGTEVLASNAMMAAHAALWAKRAGLGHAVYVSSVSVYPPAEETHVETPCQPNNLYGVSKLAGELAWQATLEPHQMGIARLAGILGMQDRPQMFWNKLLRQAFTAEAVSLEYQAFSYRNYTTSLEAAECLIRLATGRCAGTHMVAGQDEVTLHDFEMLLGPLTRARLPWIPVSDSGDRIYYRPSEVVAPWLRDFPTRLTELWQSWSSS